MIRVFSRFYALSDDVQTKKAQKQLWQWAQEWVKGDEPGNLNQAIMELGATVCVPKKPQCLLCPIQSHCQAYQDGTVDTYPIKVKKKKVLPTYYKVALINLENPLSEKAQLWVAHRKDQRVLGGMWALPLVDVSIESYQKWHTVLSLSLIHI